MARANRKYEYGAGHIGKLEQPRQRNRERHLIAAIYVCADDLRSNGASPPIWRAST